MAIADIANAETGLSVRTKLNNTIGGVNGIRENVSIAAASPLNLTQTQFEDNFRIVLTGTPGAAFTVNTPATPTKLFVVQNNSDSTATIQVTGGLGASVDVAASSFLQLYSDGADIFNLTPDTGGNVAVSDEGTEVLAVATRLNFTGAGVTATDGGSGTATVNIPGGGGVPTTWPVINLTGTAETLAVGHPGRGVILTNASAITLTVEDNATVNIPVGSWVRIIQGGAGTVSVVGSGATINSQGGLTSLNGQYAGAVLWHYATDVWLLEGNLA